MDGDSLNNTHHCVNEPGGSVRCDVCDLSPKCNTPEGNDVFHNLFHKYTFKKVIDVLVVRDVERMKPCKSKRRKEMEYQ